MAKMLWSFKKLYKGATVLGIEDKQKATEKAARGRNEQLVFTMDLRGPATCNPKK
jgi:hypothetical protein